MAREDETTPTPNPNTQQNGEAPPPRHDYHQDNPTTSDHNDNPTTMTTLPQ